MAGRGEELVYTVTLVIKGKVGAVPRGAPPDRRLGATCGVAHCRTRVASLSVVYPRGGNTL